MVSSWNIAQEKIKIILSNNIEWGSKYLDFWGEINFWDIIMINEYFSDIVIALILKKIHRG